MGHEAEAAEYLRGYEEITGYDIRLEQLRERIDRSLNLENEAHRAAVIGWAFCTGWGEPSEDPEPLLGSATAFVGHIPRAVWDLYRLVLPRHSEGWTPWFIGLDSFGAGPILVAHAGGRSADRLNELSESEAVAHLRELIGEATGVAVPEPTEVARSAWAADPYAGGAYTYLPRGASRSDLDLIGEPVAGRLLFAGEATTSARVGFADGAMTTGVREAKRLIGAPDVVLGPLPV